MPKTPKAAKASADTHREEDEEDEEQEEATVPGMAGGDGSDGGGGGGGDTPSDAGAGGTLSIITNKKVVLLLAGLAVAFLAYRYYQQNSNSFGQDRSQPTRDTSPDETQPDDEGREPMTPNIQKDPNDPLAADHEAFQWVFGDEEESESQYPGR